MTKKHFERIAAVIAGELAIANSAEQYEGLYRLTLSLADVFAQENPRFDRHKFYLAVGIGNSN